MEILINSNFIDSQLPILIADNQLVYDVLKCMERFFERKINNPQSSFESDLQKQKIMQLIFNLFVYLNQTMGGDFNFEMQRINISKNGNLQ